MSCGEGRACVQGSCQEFRNADIILAAGIVIIVIVALSTLLAFKRKAHRM